MIIKKLKSTLYTSLFCCLVLIAMGMGVFALTNADIGAYIDIGYEFTAPLLNVSDLKAALSTESVVCFDEFDNEQANSYTVDGVNVIDGLTPVDISEQQNEKVKAYSDGTTLYVLCEQGEVITFPYSVNNMFAENTYITKVEFNRVDTSYVTSMTHMFYKCSALTEIDMSGCNTSNVTAMGSMFSNCKALITVNMSGCDLSSVTGARQMFYQCIKLKTIIFDNNIDTSAMENMSYMFAGCTALTSIDVSGFNTAKVKTMSNMFNNCMKVAVLDVSKFNTSKVTNMTKMFRNCRVVTELDLSNFNTASVTNMSEMFYYANHLQTIYVGDGWSTASVTTSSGMFGNCSALSGAIDFDSTLPTDATYATTDGYLSRKPSIISVNNFRSIYNNETAVYFDYYDADSTYLNGGSENLLAGTTGVDVSQKKDRSILAYSNGSSLYILSKGPIALPEDSRYVFKEYYLIEAIKFNNINTLNVTDMTQMFYGCKRLKSLTLSEDFITSKVTCMYSMFGDCANLTSLDLSTFDTSNVTDMWGMFQDCEKLTSLDLSSFDTSNVTNMGFMFDGCAKLTSLDLLNFNTSSVTNISTMFGGCALLESLDLSSFDTSKVTYMYMVFYNCSNLTTIYVSNLWSIESITYDASVNSYGTFLGCTSLVGAISYNSGLTSATYATTDGYLTLKTA